MRHCHLCKNHIEIDWKNAELLRRFMNDQNQIASARRTGTCAKHQRRVAHAIKRARIMGVVPFSSTITR